MTTFQFLLAILLLTLGPLGAEMREFTTSDGRKVQAELVGLEGTAVSLRTANGQTIEADLSRFSEPDREYIDLWATAPGQSPAGGLSMADYLASLGYASIAFTDSDYAMIVELQIADRPHQFLVNTSLPYSYLDGSIADILGLQTKSLGQVRADVSGALLPVSEGRLESFQIGATTIPSHTFRITSLNQSGITNDQIKADGVLGFDFLQTFKVVIDYKAKRMHFLVP